MVFEVNLLNTCAVCPLLKKHKAAGNHIFAFVLFELHSSTIILLPLAFSDTRKVEVVIQRRLPCEQEN